MRVPFFEAKGQKVTRVACGVSMTVVCTRDADGTPRVFQAGGPWTSYFSYTPKPFVAPQEVKKLRGRHIR